MRDRRKAILAWLQSKAILNQPPDISSDTNNATPIEADSEKAQGADKASTTRTQTSTTLNSEEQSVQVFSHAENTVDQIPATSGAQLVLASRSPLTAFSNIPTMHDPSSLATELTFAASHSVPTLEDPAILAVDGLDGRPRENMWWNEEYYVQSRPCHFTERPYITSSHVCWLCCGQDSIAWCSECLGMHC